jgi:hypothetical protein
MFKPVHEMIVKPKAQIVSTFGQRAQNEQPQRATGFYVEMPEGRFARRDFGVEGGTIQRPYIS